MLNITNELLINTTAKHVQFCNGLKALIDGGCSVDSISNVIEELCNQSENIHQLSSSN
ncbi:MAG: hypothetical protein ACI9YH_004566 [Colwellia sp.]|jgi:hypothetical protein